MLQSCSAPEFLTFSSSLLWKLLSRWWKWISVICCSRERRQETYSPCTNENRHTYLKKITQLQIVTKFHLSLLNVKEAHWVEAYRYLGSALGTALSSGRLHRVRLAHDGQQSLQQHIQKALHHHLHFLLNRRLLEASRRKQRNAESTTERQTCCSMLQLH